MFKINNKNTRTTKLEHQNDLIVDFEQISHLVRALLFDFEHVNTDFIKS